MNNLFSPAWWISMLLSTVVTMIFIYLIKKMTVGKNVPVLSAVAEGV